MAKAYLNKENIELVLNDMIDRKREELIEQLTQPNIEERAIYRASIEVKAYRAVLVNLEMEMDDNESEDSNNG